MASTNFDVDKFKNIARDNPNLRWFAIADSAQNSHLPNALAASSRDIRCLFGGAQDTPLARQSPHLVELCSPTYVDRAWIWISQNARLTSSVSIIATLKDFSLLYEHMASCTQVQMPDLETMFFAFWDPAILGTLVGQPDDLTLHVPGPVLNQDQQSLLTDGLEKWWYWDRSGSLHEVSIREQRDAKVLNSIELNQQQVDDLVEASVPDHVMYYVKLNQPYLIDKVPPIAQYEVIRNALIRARRIGLVSMRDLVDFVCIVLLYKERLERDESIVAVLKKVEVGEIDFQTALGYLP